MTKNRHNSGLFLLICPHNLICAIACVISMLLSSYFVYCFQKYSCGFKLTLITSKCISLFNLKVLLFEILGRCKISSGFFNGTNVLYSRNRFFDNIYYHLVMSLLIYKKRIKWNMSSYERNSQLFATD